MKNKSAWKISVKFRQRFAIDQTRKFRKNIKTL